MSDQPRAGEPGREAIVCEAERAQDDDRYGHFTNPFILGLLTAVAILDGTYNNGRWTH